MNYWWANQNQTYVHEVGGGYLWSPKVNADGRRNRFYDAMTEAAPGDVGRGNWRPNTSRKNIEGYSYGN